MKKAGLLIIAGIIPLLVVVLFMNFISLNLSYSFLIGIISLLIVSIWQHKNVSHFSLKFLLISIPLTSAYYFLIIKELNGLWIVLPMFIITIILGLTVLKRKLKIAMIFGLMAFTSLISFLLIPQIISNDLSQSINKTAPKFEFVDLLTSKKLNNAILYNKVVVLDFFGTWCAPCIAEMNELKEIKQKLSGYQNELTFVIVCTDTGKDTPEKAKKFHSKRQLPFLLAFDYNSSAHKSFKFTGVPGLVIIDKKGKMRFKHEGYNQAEDLQKTLIPVLKELLNEK